MNPILIFDWGDCVMRDFPDYDGPMIDWPEVAFIPGVEQALIVLSVDFHCVVASNAGDSNTFMMISALQRLNADRFFSHFFTSKDLEFEKPDKRFFYSIADSLSVDSSQCIMIGNDYRKDIEGAAAAGMKTVFFNEKMLKGNFPDASEIIFHMDELDKAIHKVVNS